MQEQWHEQERFASIAAGETIEEEHQITLKLKDKTILPDGYQWEEKGREFSHNGMFYDIVSLTKTEAGWELVAASDEEEAKIVANQSKALKEDRAYEANKKSTKQKFNFNISIFDQICASQCQQAFLQLNQIAYSNVQVRLTQTSLGQISPPPEAV